MLDDASTHLMRQRNNLNKEWYGLCFIYQQDSGEASADNEEWIVTKMYDSLINKDYIGLNTALGVDWDKKKWKKVGKMFARADMAGWFLVARAGWEDNK